MVLPRLSSSLESNFDSQVLLWLQDSCYIPTLCVLIPSRKRRKNVENPEDLPDLCFNLLLTFGCMSLGNVVLGWTHCHLEWNVLSVNKEENRHLGRQLWEITVMHYCLWFIYYRLSEWNFGKLYSNT